MVYLLPGLCYLDYAIWTVLLSTRALPAPGWPLTPSLDLHANIASRSWPDGSQSPVLRMPGPAIRPAPEATSTPVNYKQPYFTLYNSMLQSLCASSGPWDGA